jgi:hypothetical protein
MFMIDPFGLILAWAATRSMGRRGWGLERAYLSACGVCLVSRNDAGFNFG